MTRPDTEPPKSHSLFHTWLAELFVSIDTNLDKIPINLSWSNFSEATLHPWTLTHARTEPLSECRKAPLSQPLLKIGWSQRKTVPNQLSGQARCSSHLPTPSSCLHLPIKAKPFFCLLYRSYDLIDLHIRALFPLSQPPFPTAGVPFISCCYLLLEKR